MPDTFEQQIVDYAIGLLETVTIAHGYRTDLGNNVEDSRPNWQEDELPATSVFLGTAEVVDNADNISDCVRVVPLMVRHAWKRKDVAADDAAYGRKAIQDVHAAFGTDPRFNALLMRLRPSSHGLDIADESYEITGAQATFEIAYLAKKFDLTQR